MDNEENVANATLKLLQSLRSDISGMRTEMQGEFRDVKGRLSHLEASVAAVCPWKHNRAAFGSISVPR